MGILWYSYGISIGFLCDFYGNQSQSIESKLKSIESKLKIN